tara:strand:- start:272 stop:721 length:450 start_codon:yes stop_codon:yes gene_type:complete
MVMKKDRLDVLSDIHKNFKAIGLAIKKAREEQNISIVFLSEALKINEDYLMAIENGDKSSLPELVYVKAMLRKIFERLNIETVDTKIKHSSKEKGNILKNESKKVTGKSFYLMISLLSLVAIIFGVYSTRFILLFNSGLDNKYETISSP